MPAPRQLPLLIAMGLAAGLLIGLALAHFLWIAVVVILGFVALDFFRRRR